MPELPWIKDMLTMGTAVGGFVLGVFNFIHARRAQRVRLRLIPQIAYEVGGGVLRANRPSPNTPKRLPDLVCLEVTNLSSFPVTVSDAGFTMNGKIGKSARRAILHPVMMDEGRWPRRLEARSMVCLYVRFDNLDANIRKAYVETDCGEVAYGTSPALEEARKLLSA